MGAMEDLGRVIRRTRTRFSLVRSPRHGLVQVRSLFIFTLPVYCIMDFGGYPTDKHRQAYDTPRNQIVSYLVIATRPFLPSTKI